jgi:hypothetical protein
MNKETEKLEKLNEENKKLLELFTSPNPTSTQKGSASTTIVVPNPSNRNLQQLEQLEMQERKTWDDVQKKSFKLNHRHLKYGLIGLGAMWAITEAALAYNNLKDEANWHNAGYLKPVLWALQTTENMVSRPADIIRLIKNKLFQRQRRRPEDLPVLFKSN